LYCWREAEECPAKYRQHDGEADDPEVELGLVEVWNACRGDSDEDTQQTFGESFNAWEMGLGFGLAALFCGAATIVPIRNARTRLENVER